jgi:hypothetical protein
MSEIIDFKEALIVKETNPDYIITAPDGSKWYKFTAKYEFECSQGWGLPKSMLDNLEGVTPNVSEYGIDIWAQSEEEALKRVEAIKNTIVYDSRICDRI